MSLAKIGLRNDSTTYLSVSREALSLFGNPTYDLPVFGPGAAIGGMLCSPFQPWRKRRKYSMITISQYSVEWKSSE
jgi:hypothetical protein